MKTKLFDLETDGLLDVVSVIHCGTVYELETDEIRHYGPDSIPALVADIQDADVLAGHYICGFDMHVLEKLAGVDPWNFKYIDTKVFSQALFPGPPSKSPLATLDIAFRAKYGEKALPGDLIGSHKLMAWSIRLRLGDQGKLAYDGGWDKWTQEMSDYNVNDVVANSHLLQHFMKKDMPIEVVHAESWLTYLLTKQEQYGVAFDEPRAVELMTDLVDQTGRLERELQEVFPPIEVPHGKPKVAKTNRNGRKIGETYQLYKTQAFNPNSEAQIAQRLTERYGWEPQSYTPGGKPSVTTEILDDLPFPEAALLSRYGQLQRVIGYLYTGKQAWLSAVRNGRIHGQVTLNAARTTRCGHSRPNLGQVPTHGKAYGDECRELFRAGEGKVLVGADATGLQLALYAHFVARYDNGELASICEDPEGDPHEYMRSKSGLWIRGQQKKVTYATWFGAGDYKIGTLALTDWHMALAEGKTTEPAPPLSEAARLGSQVIRRMRENMAGYDDLAKDTRKAAKRGYITLLNGHPVKVKQARTVLVTLLQGCEAVIMKRAYLTAVERLRYLIEDGKAHPVLWIHDEFQWECDPDVATEVGMFLASCIAEAGAYYNLRLKLRGDYKIGATWKETH